MARNPFALQAKSSFIKSYANLRTTGRATAFTFLEIELEGVYQD
jgi:hypothetical protein